MPPGASMKPKKGKQETVRSNLAHILGYTGTDVDPVGPPSPVGSEKEAAGTAACHVILPAELQKSVGIRYLAIPRWSCSTAQ